MTEFITKESKITFVTSFIDIYETTFEDKTIEWRFEKFRDIVSTGIQICVYVSPECYDVLYEFVKDFANVKIMKRVSIESTWIAKECADVEYYLPEYRNYPKDIPHYMMLINSKCEFLYDAIQENPWGSTHFAWIDFSISYVFHNKEATLEYLAALSLRTFIKEPFLLIPGCWDKIAENNVDQISNGVYWRYCGGFLLGDAKSVEQMFLLYKQYYPEWIRTHQKLVWEVNFWAWLEANTEWSPRWYKADHNDCIIHIPLDVCCIVLIQDGFDTMTTYDYPQIDTYEPASASYIYFQGKHILNTRYVNYWYWETGHCHIKHPEDFIITKNICSELDEDTLTPMFYKEMDDASVGFQSKRCYFYGLEDIRLYEYRNTIRFIATNIDYSPMEWNRMIVGEYHPDTQTYSNCRITEPPYESWCEKNWIPLVRKEPIGDNGELIEQEYFIYKWYPMEVGKLDENNKLNIVYRHIINAPEFHRVRGSTQFIDNGEYLIGLVHLSESTLPRRYYHIMVALDRTTFKPTKYSEIFSFRHIGIEFCIGFAIRNRKYVFWTSLKDREPMMVMCDFNRIPLIYDFW
jgi:hypothetical protein